MRLFKSTQSHESKYGTDLEIIVRCDGNRAIILTVQCKKLGYKDRYDNLNYKVRSTSKPQIDLLERHAQKIGAIPLYLLYNYVPTPESEKCWNCCQGFDLCQFGCTFVPSWLIRNAINQWGSRNFRAIHNNKGSLPWRCTFDCPNGSPDRLLDDCKTSLNSMRRLARGSGLVERYEWIDYDPRENVWPNWLWHRYKRTPESTWSSQDYVANWSSFEENERPFQKTDDRAESIRNIESNLLNWDDILELYRPTMTGSYVALFDESNLDRKALMVPRWILLVDLRE